VLEAAIAAGGSSLRDYVQSDGELGNFQRHFLVYDLAGSPCPRCAAPVARLVQSARATYWCSACQR
jgi:formamidopyrimidine-DNA glycosylase